MNGDMPSRYGGERQRVTLKKLTLDVDHYSYNRLRQGHADGQQSGRLPQRSLCCMASGDTLDHHSARALQQEFDVLAYAEPERPAEIDMPKVSRPHAAQPHALNQLARFAPACDDVLHAVPSRILP
jgi:hypothetical protein